MSLSTETAQNQNQSQTTPMIGLLDSGISRPQMAHLATAKAFVEPCALAMNSCDPLSLDSNIHSDSPAYQDRLGHGSTLAQVLIDQVPQVRLAVAKIFDRQLTTNVTHTAAGLNWLVEQGARVINLSFGLRQDRQPLASACQRALDAGVVLVAASPAMGDPVYPACYPGVIRVTGDARCQADEHSWRPSRQADFGACVRAGHPRVIGASVATAYISARIGRYLQRFPQQPVNACHLYDWLTEQARYQGAQRPFALIPWKRRLTWQPEVL